MVFNDKGSMSACAMLAKWYCVVHVSKKIHAKVVIHRVNLIFISRQLPGFEWSVNLLENCSRESNGSIKA